MTLSSDSGDLHRAAKINLKRKRALSRGRKSLPIRSIGYSMIYDKFLFFLLGLDFFTDPFACK